MWQPWKPNYGSDIAFLEPGLTNEENVYLRNTILNAQALQRLQQSPKPFYPYSSSSSSLMPPPRTFFNTVLNDEGLIRVADNNVVVDAAPFKEKRRRSVRADRTRPRTFEAYEKPEQKTENRGGPRIIKSRNAWNFPPKPKPKTTRKDVDEDEAIY